MKKCSKCRVDKKLSEFNKDSSKVDGYSYYCKECSREYGRKYSKDNRDKAVAFVNSIKKSKGCAKCGIKLPYVLDFHHLNPEVKSDNISKLTQRASGNPSLRKIKKEIQKCIVLCKNHHSEFHHLERENGITIEDYLTSMCA